MMPIETEDEQKKVGLEVEDTEAMVSNNNNSSLVTSSFRKSYATVVIGKDILRKDAEVTPM